MGSLPPAVKYPARIASHHILFYDYVEDIVERRGPHRDAHLAWITAQHEAGDVVIAGAVGEPVRGGVIVFHGLDPEAILARSDEDPYWQAGLVADRRVEPWNVVTQH
jgi:uncharacterized protein YciI